MLPIERQSFIIAKLSEEESVRTMDLATTLEVTDETVRKDLESLELRGELLRIHGGAVRPNQSRVELALNERKQVNREAKTAIARLAAKQIEPNDTIFIDASSTALTLVEHLPGFHLTVLTNAHNVITALADREGIDIVVRPHAYVPSGMELHPTADTTHRLLVKRLSEELNEVQRVWYLLFHGHILAEDEYTVFVILTEIPLTKIRQRSKHVRCK